MMTDSARIYVDSAPLIYLLDRSHPLNQKTKSVFRDLISQNCHLSTSVLTWMEFLSFPSGPDPDQAFLTLQRFCSELDFSVLNINAAVSLKAAKIRRQYPGFKSMDSLHLACACVFGCDTFLTNDRQLSAFRELKVVLIS